MARAAFLPGLLIGASLLLLSGEGAGDCIPFTEAHKHIGETRCVSGKVFAVEPGNRGIHYLDFCENYQVCPFTVVIFPGNLKDVGDVRQLRGQTIEIHGPVKLYDGRAEIILREYRQLGGEAARIPPLPRNYDVETKGRFSAGQFSHPQSARKPAKKRQGPPLQTDEVDNGGAEQ